MNDTSTLLGIVGTIIAAIMAAWTWSQKMLVTVLKDQIAAGERREASLLIDNKEQAVTISKMAVSVDKLTEQGAQTIKLLEDVVYGRQATSERRRGS